MNDVDSPTFGAGIVVLAGIISRSTSAITAEERVLATIGATGLGSFPTPTPLQEAGDNTGRGVFAIAGGDAFSAVRTSIADTAAGSAGTSNGALSSMGTPLIVDAG